MTEKQIAYLKALQNAEKKGSISKKKYEKKIQEFRKIYKTNEMSDTKNNI